MLHAEIQDHRTSGSGGEYFLGFYHIWTWRPSWSCELDHLYNFSFPLPKEAPHKIWILLAKRFQRRRSLKMVDDDDNDDDGAWVYYKLTYEPSAQMI